MQRQEHGISTKPAVNLGAPALLTATSGHSIITGCWQVSTKIDKPGQKGYAVGFDGLIKFIMEQLPQNEIVTSALREHMQLVPETVIRELVANALVH